MKNLSLFVVSLVGLIFVVWLSTGCDKKSGMTKSDIIGVWHSVVDSSLEDGMGFKSNYIEVFYEDGSFYQNGIEILYDAKTKKRLFTYSGPAKGVWTIEGGDLRLVWTEIQTDFFSTVFEEPNRAEFEVSLIDDLGTPEHKRPSSVLPNKLILKSVEEGDVYEMNRIRVDVTSPESADPFMLSLATYKIEDLWADPTVKEVEGGVDLVGQKIRRTSLILLEDEGFSPASDLPTYGRRAGIGADIRPAAEVRSRLLAMYALICWVVYDEEQVKTSDLKKLIKIHNLESQFTSKEREIIALDRKQAQQKYFDSIGWKMENMWALAWVIGFEVMPEVNHGQVGQEVMEPLMEFLNIAWESDELIAEKLELRSLAEVRQLEDLFYCAHNAVRSAQLGEKGKVPKEFHAIIHGGAVHERRHSLTWALSPKVEWADTDLST